MKNLILIVFFHASLYLFSQDVSVILHMPPNADDGVEFEISLTVNKADVTGFARLQLDFPEGFTVRGGQTQGATFSYRDNKARFLWMSLPSDRTLKVSCMVTPQGIAGIKTIEGSFSYVFNNETQRYTIPQQNVSIAGTALASASNQEKERLAQEAAQKEAERLERERQERLAREREAHEREARERAEREARENAERLAQQSQPTPEIVEVVVETTPAPAPTPEPLPLPTTPAATPKSEPAPVEQPRTVPTTTTRTTQTPPSPATTTRRGGVEYKVQVGAFRNAPDPSYFRKLENSITDHKINSSRDNDGFTRYTIGSFSSFSAVEAFLNRVQQLGYTSFIIAVQDGRRITIKQAKEISQN